MTALRLGTRASELATTQSGHVAARITEQTGREVELVEVVTKGDVSRAPLNSFGGQGVFVAALRDALADGQCDLAVHSLKDLPTTPDPRLRLVAVPLREDPRDALIARDGLTLGELPVGSKVGTGSQRRIAQLNALGLGLETVGIRGNVGTRIAKVTSGELDAVVLACAGLRRIGRIDEATELIDPLQMLPAPGQGALAIECRSDDAEMIALLSGLDDADTRAATTAERSLLSTLEAGCSAPVGALAEVVSGESGDELWLRAMVADASGTPVLRSSVTGSPADAEQLGRTLAAELLADGADRLIAVAPVHPDSTAVQQGSAT